jgi:hypothetical protein
MADYYPLIARAVQGLPDPAPEMRAAVYDRARTALFAQLRSLDPPLSEAEFEAERDALETAIASVEAEYSGPPPPEETEYAPPAPEEPGIPEPEQESAPDYAPSEEPGPAAHDFATGNGAQAADAPPPGLAPTGAYQAPPPQEPLPYRAHGAEASPEPAGPTMAQPEPANLPPPAAANAAPRASGKPGKARPRVNSVSPKNGSGGGMRAAIVAVSLIAVIGLIAFVAYWLSRDAQDEIATAPPVIETPDRGAAEERIEERLGETPAIPGEERVQPAEPAPEPPAALQPPEGGVAQRAILYEEDPSAPSGDPRASAGGAVWELLPPESGESDPRVRAMVQFPDVNITMTMLMERNLDPSLPASHTIEITFETDGRESRNVRDIGLLQLKEEEVVRGAPIAGLPVPIDDNFFLIGLSNVASDVQRNRNLLTQRNWIDIPIRFAGGQRAIISFEKGFSGDQAIAQAFAAWD